MRNLYLFFLIAAFSMCIFAQDKTTGGVRGKVRLTDGKTLAGVAIEVRQSEKPVAVTKTDNKGDFQLVGLKPGVYNLIFTKEGLSQGTLPRVEVKAGEVLKLTKLVMGVDQGALAILRGSIFDANGRSVYGAKVEVFKISGDSKKVAQIFSSESGEFIFRLPPAEARYRVSVTIDGAERGSQEIEVNGAQVYRVAVSLKPRS